MRKILTGATVISAGLLAGVFGAIETKGAPISSCIELPGNGSTPSGPGAVTGVQSGFSILNVYVWVKMTTFLKMRSRTAVFPVGPKSQAMA